MTIAELFVNLGIKGDGSANKALKSVKGGLEEVRSMSLEAKAAIVATIYALERMMSTSAQQGAGLTNFAAATGLSIKQLQEWQYAARQVNVSNDEMAGSIKGVQQNMANMLLGKGAPEGFAMVANKVGLDKDKLRDTFYVMTQLQKFAQQVPPDVGAQMVKSFGISEGVFAGMRRNAFNTDVFAKAPRYSENEAKSLDKINAGWSNLGTKIQMTIGHLNAAHGGQLIKDITQLTTAALKLLEALIKISETLKVFSAIGKAFEGWTSFFNLIGGTAKNISADKGGVFEGLKKEGASIFKNMEYFGMGLQETLKEAISPKVAPANNSNSNQQNNIEINNHFQHDGKNAHDVGHSVSKAVKGAMYQMQATTQVA